jgi:carboxymethylenebutenolidase
MTMIEISAADGTAEAWVSRPDDEPRPGVLLFIDAIGLRPEIGRIADRIASWGYVVLAPNLFYRAGTAAELAPHGPLTEPGAREAFFATVGPRISGLTTENVVQDIATYRTALRSIDGVGPGPIGVTAYCLGARLAVRAACLHDDSPHLGLPNARAAFVLGHGDNDQSMGPEAVEALDNALAATGLAHSNEIYPGSAHGYVMSDTSMYDQTGAERHYAELRELLDRALA